MNQSLPMTRAEMKERGWNQLDFIFVNGDAYVDHPSFGVAIITRLLEAHGFRVGVIAQPDWKDDESITILGKPRLGFLVSAGNMDSMVNHYTVLKKRRQTDAYTPGGEVGKRPNYATIVYSNLIRKIYKETPIILGGLEASLRRLAHYDYWSNKLKRSLLLDAGADILVYGMGERAILEIAELLVAGIKVEDITYLPGTVVRMKNLDLVYEPVLLPDFPKMQEETLLYAKSFYAQYQNTDPFTAKPLVESYSPYLYVVQNPPAKPLTRQELDDIYAFPYTRQVHPHCLAKGKVAAIEEVKFSLTNNRGCFGGCNFCSLTFHQGRIVQARSHESIVAEAKELIKDKEFKGYIHDVGGPTANFRHPSCEKQLTQGVCMERQCLFPTPCSNLKVDHQDYLQLLRKLRKLSGVKKVFIRSGIRFDYLMADKDRTFLKELCEHHISGQLRVAPEHVSEEVLKVMGKPKSQIYQTFVEAFKRMNQKTGKKQFIVPYLMSSHPGSTMKDALELAQYCKGLGHLPEQVQDFYPTPSTISTCMYYTGVDPRTMRPVYVARSFREKELQRKILQPQDRRKARNSKKQQETTRNNKKQQETIRNNKKQQEAK